MEFIGKVSQISDTDKAHQEIISNLVTVVSILNTRVERLEKQIARIVNKIQK